MKKLTILLLLMSIIQSCKQSSYKLDLQGHRGCRGLMPENTIEGFIKSLEIGVTTLEMDLVISKDEKVVVSHEPFFSHEISSTPNGKEIDQNSELDHNMYQLSYQEIKAYDVGLKKHDKFPEQLKVASYKPLLSEVFFVSESYASKRKLKQPFYNIEIKRKPEFDGIYHPPVKQFVELVLAEVKKQKVENRTCIQSFDIEALQLVKKMAPNLTTALLTYDETSLDKNLELLGFIPDIYSPYHKLVTQKLVSQCKKENMQIIPWTINNETEMRRVLDLKVDGIISDYPNLVKSLLDELAIEIK